MRAEVFSLTTWTPLQFFDAGSRWLEDEYRRIHELPQGINIAAHFLRRCEWLELAERAEQHMSGRFSYGALFAVKQNLLHAFPQRSLSLAIGAAGAHSTYGYVIERLWLHMCGAPFLHFAPNSAPDNKQAEQAGPQLWPVPAPSQPPRSRRIMPGLKKRVLAWAMT